MKKALKIVLGSLACLLLIFAIGGTLHRLKSHKSKRVRAQVVPVTEEKPMVVIIPSYNNSAYCEQNVRSVLAQDYNNYRVIYIDDCSKDDTCEKVKELLINSKEGHRVTLIHNSRNQGALANLYYAIHSCRNDEIIITVDGDDFLAHPYVLKKLNQVYANPKIWMTYGNYLDYPSYKQKPAFCKKIPQTIVQNNSFRSHEWSTSHLRTFYAGLFKQVKLQDFLYQGHFLPMAWDMAFMMPMLEMSGKHVQFIKDTLYLYNRSNPINDHKVNFKLQQDCDGFVRSLAKYARLKSRPLEEIDGADLRADIVLFSDNNPEQLKAQLVSVYDYVKGIEKSTVIYRADSEASAKAYEELQKEFTDVAFLQQSDQPEQSFRPLLLKTAFDMAYSPSKYLLFFGETAIAKEAIDLQDCISAMEETGAHAFFLGQSLDQGQELPPMVKLGRNVFAWQFKDGAGKWNFPHTADRVLYRKQDVFGDLYRVYFNNPATLQNFWSPKIRGTGLGLCYDTQKTTTLTPAPSTQ